MSPSSQDGSICGSDREGPEKRSPTSHLREAGPFMSFQSPSWSYPCFEGWPEIPAIKSKSTLVVQISYVNYSRCYGLRGARWDYTTCHDMHISYGLCHSGYYSLITRLRRAVIYSSITGLAEIRSIPYVVFTVTMPLFQERSVDLLEENRHIYLKVLAGSVQIRTSLPRMRRL